MTGTQRVGFIPTDIAPRPGLLHGINALVLFVVAWIAARRAGSTAGLTAGADQPASAQTTRV